MEVYKFGGASVKDAAAIRNVAAILRQSHQRPLAVVISAMGKTTNALESIIDAYYHHPDSLQTQVELLKEYHQHVSQELLGETSSGLLNDLHDLWVELGWI